MEVFVLITHLSSDETLVAHFFSKLQFVLLLMELIPQVLPVLKWMTVDQHCPSYLEWLSQGFTNHLPKQFLT